MNIRNAKNQARFFMFCAVASILLFLLWMVGSSLTADFSLVSPATFLLSLPATAFALLCGFHGVLLLDSVGKSETPFRAKNIRHLKWIGWLFVAYEPISYLCQAITNRYFPISLGNGYHMTTSHSYGGVFLICGFVILTISAVFRYGMELQQLSDETI